MQLNPSALPKLRHFQGSLKLAVCAIFAYVKTFSS